MDVGQRRLSADDDGPGAGAFLRRACAAQKYAGHYDAELCIDGADYGDVGAGWIQLVLWRKRAGDWRIRTRIPARRGSGPQSRLCSDDPADDFHDLPVDVCGD